MVGHENLGLAIVVRVHTSQLFRVDENKRGCGESFFPRFSRRWRDPARSGGGVRVNKYE